jgi:hypothetical protein
MKASSDWLAVAEASGFEEEVGWLKTCLSWAAEWSECNGVLELTTPFFRVCQYREGRSETLRIRRVPVYVATDAPAGLMFPYVNPSSKNLVKFPEKTP